jgi:hypothetical protein
MEQPEGEEPKKDAQDEREGPKFRAEIKEEYKYKPKTSAAPDNEGRDSKSYLHYLWRKIIADQIDRIAELVFAFAVVFFAGAQWITSCQNNASTTQQTDQLIAAAKISAYAAQQNTLAAQNFADSARKINGGISDAVDKLNLQASALVDSDEQASRLATATESANANAVNADRPWLGAYMTLDTPVSEGNTPTAAITFINSGKRPAQITLSAAKPDFFKAFPKEPAYDLPASSSQSFLVPGAPFQMHLKLSNGGDGKITTDMMKRLQGPETLFIYSKIEYVDTGTGVHHHTHACWKYIVDPKGAPSGFYNCGAEENYNDAN